MDEIIVGMGDIDIGCDGDLLVSLGLGSCVGIVLYDSENKVGGLAHIMLPDSKEVGSKTIEKDILIAETDNLIIFTLKKILEKGNYNIIANTKEADETLAEYEKKKPKVVLISAFLPPTNGMDAVKNLLSIDKNAAPVVLSPSIGRDVLLHYIRGGAKDVLQNPYTEEKVLSTIDYVLNRNNLKFADIAIPLLLNRMVNMGAKKKNIIAKIIGGAHLFTSIMDQKIMNIGNKNVEAVKNILHSLNIRITFEETGSNIGRTIKFGVGTGVLTIKTKDGIKEA